MMILKITEFVNQGVSVKHGCKQYNTPAKTKGFTIMEVIIVISIVGILLTLATPSVRSMIDKQRVRGTCDSIYQNLAIARSSSVSLNKDVIFNFRSSNAGATWCVGVSDVAACDCSTALPSCTVDGIVRGVNSDAFGGGNSGIAVTGIADNTSVTFSARDAAPAATPPDARVASSLWTCGVRVEPLGQVRLLKVGSGDSIRTVVPLAESGGLN